MSIEKTPMQQLTSTLRGFYYPGIKSDRYQGTQVAELADDYSKYYTDKSGLTVSLEDFSCNLQTDYEELGSNIKKQDCMPTGTDNFIPGATIFQTNRGQKILDDCEGIFQAQLFIEGNNKNGGVKYIKDGDNPYEAALNFAKADIRAIEKSAVVSEVESLSYMDGKLSPFESCTFIGYCFEDENSDCIRDIDLDGDVHNVSAEEYASWMLAADNLTAGLSTSLAGLGSDLVDGLLTKEDKEALENMDFDYVKSKAKTFYSNYQDAE